MKQINAKVIVLICAKNEEGYIEKTLNALLNQTLKPYKIVVVDDGSKDKTPKILREYRKKYDNIVVFTRPDRGFSALGTYLMADTYNTGLKYIQEQDYDYLMIVGADTILPPNYIEEMVKRFVEDPKLGIASGMDPDEPISKIHVSGTGRMIRGTIAKKMGLLPRIYAWETYEIVFVKINGYHAKNFPDLHFKHQRPGGKGHMRSYYGWGRAMRELGYHPLYAFGRFMMNIIRGHPSWAIAMMRGYIKGGRNDPKLLPMKKYMWNYQRSYLSHLPLKLIPF